MIAAVRWRWRRRRARRYARAAYLAYQRRPNRVNAAAMTRADKFLERVECGRP